MYAMIYVFMGTTVKLVYVITPVVASILINCAGSKTSHFVGATPWTTGDTVHAWFITHSNGGYVTEVAGREIAILIGVRTG